MGNLKTRRYMSWYRLLLIAIIGTLVFNFYPLIETFITSLKNMNGSFIGFTNYKILFSSDEFRQSIINTLYMAVLGVGLNVPLAFIIASVLNSIAHGKGIYRVGQGISCAVGMAIAGKRDKKDYRVYTLVGDGECGEGQVWEAAMAANKYQLDNFTVIIDNNGLQNDGFAKDIMPTLDLEKKFEAFGFQTVRIDGHDVLQIEAALDFMQTQKNGKPKCIVCNTVKGKGVSFMENVPKWHGVAPNDEEYALAMKEIEEGF